jgi:hypothetical protein
MTTKQWYRAHLRWAVMTEGKEGLRGNTATDVLRLGSELAIRRS